MAITDEDLSKIAWAVVQAGTPDLPQEIARAVAERPEFRAQLATINALAAAVAQIHGLDQAQLISDIRAAIAAAVVDVNVTVHDGTVG